MFVTQKSGIGSSYLVRNQSCKTGADNDYFGMFHSPKDNRCSPKKNGNFAL